MLFFSEQVSKAAELYPTLFSRVERAEGEDENSKESDEAPQSNFGFTLLSMIGATIEYTQLNIRQVYEMQAKEMFTYVQFIMERERRKANEIKKLQRQ